MSYANGQVPASALTTVQGSIQLETTTATHWYSMKSAAASAGFAISIATPVGGYRSYALQQAMIADPNRNADYNLKPGVPLAGVGKSSHGYGSAVDVTGSAAAKGWVLAHCGAFGFYRSFGAADPTHCQYGGAPPVAGGGGGANTRHQEDEMGTYYIRYTSSNPNEWIAVNDMNKTYRIIPPGGWEDARLTVLDQAGVLYQMNISDPIWGQTYGNGQFTQIP